MSSPPQFQSNALLEPSDLFELNNSRRILPSKRLVRDNTPHRKTNRMLYFGVLSKNFATDPKESFFPTFSSHK
jgi:hypothetical protein